MAFIPLAASVKATLQYTVGTRNPVNTLWFRDTTDSITTTKMSLLGAALIAWWTLRIAPLVSNTLSLAQVTVTDWSSINAPGVIVASGAPGLIVSPILPLNNSLTVTFRTLARGRSFRGRNYVVGLTEGQVASNSVLVGDADDFEDAYTLMASDIQAVDPDWEHVVASFQAGGAPRIDGVATPVISTVVVNDIIKSQRGRLPT